MKIRKHKHYFISCSRCAKLISSCKCQSFKIRSYQICKTCEEEQTHLFHTEIPGLLDDLE